MSSYGFGDDAAAIFSRVRDLLALFHGPARLAQDAVWKGTKWAAASCLGDEP